MQDTSYNSVRQLPSYQKREAFKNWYGTHLAQLISSNKIFFSSPAQQKQKIAKQHWERLIKKLQRTRRIPKLFGRGEEAVNTKSSKKWLYTALVSEVYTRTAKLSFHSLLPVETTAQCLLQGKHVEKTHTDFDEMTDYCESHACKSQKAMRHTSRPPKPAACDKQVKRKNLLSNMGKAVRCLCVFSFPLFTHCS